MTSSFIDKTGPARNSYVRKPRGLLLVPPEVEAIVNEQEAKRPMGAEARKCLINSLTLQFFYENHYVASRG